MFSSGILKGFVMFDEHHDEGMTQIESINVDFENEFLSMGGIKP